MTAAATEAVKAATAAAATTAAGVVIEAAAAAAAAGAAAMTTAATMASAALVPIVHCYSVSLLQAKSPDGPTVKFLVQNVHTMDELKLTGNHLKGSRCAADDFNVMQFAPAASCSTTHSICTTRVFMVYVCLCLAQNLFGAWYVCST
jgi:hypothetical protein